MEYKDLTAFVLMLVMIGLIAGVGVLVLDRFGTSGGVTISTGVTNETHAFSSNVFTTTYIDQGIYAVSIGNSSVTYACAVAGSANCNYSSLTGIVTGSQTIGDDSISANYTYLKNSSVTTTVHAARNAISDIPEDWMSLIVTIGVLAIILGLVLMSFSMATGKDR